MSDLMEVLCAACSLTRQVPYGPVGECPNCARQRGEVKMRTEIDRLPEYPTSVQLLQARITALESSLESARQALDERGTYVQHADTCPTWHHRAPGCTCGLEKILARAALSSPGAVPEPAPTPDVQAEILTAGNAHLASYPPMFARAAAPVTPSETPAGFQMSFAKAVQLGKEGAGVDLRDEETRETSCTELSGPQGYVCGLRVGHAGDHLAFGSDNEVCHRWAAPVVERTASHTEKDACEHEQKQGGTK